MAEQRIVKLGLDKRFKDMIAAVIGQMSDGYWENTPKMKGYWVFADAGTQGDECVLEIDTRTWDPVHNAHNLWTAMDDAHIKRFLADKIKFLIKEEGFDWDRANTEETDYLSYSDPYKVKDCYYAYEVLKGRNVNKHPEYSEAFYAEKDGKDYQIEIELEDGPNIEDPEKLTVIVGDEKETIDVPKGGTDDHYKKAIDAGLKKLGYKMVEGKLPGVDEVAKKPLYAYIGYSGSWGDGDDEKTKLPAGDSYLDIVSKHFDMKPEEIDAKWREKLTDCKTDADFGKVLAAMYDAMEAFVFALRRGNECVWANPKGSEELDDKDWQGPDYDWLTTNV